MQFNVSSLLQEHTGALREYDIDDDVRIDGETHHFFGRCRLDRTPRGVLVRARLHGEASADCSRCLKPAQYPIDLVIEEEYIPTIDIINGGRVEPSETELDAYRISARHMLDLAEPVRQYWEMALPMAPVCADECRGLCQTCGAEIESDGHTCATDASDARWSKLSELKLR